MLPGELGTARGPARPRFLLILSRLEAHGTPLYLKFVLHLFSIVITEICFKKSGATFKESEMPRVLWAPAKHHCSSNGAKQLRRACPGRLVPTPRRLLSGLKPQRNSSQISDEPQDLAITLIIPNELCSRNTGWLMKTCKIFKRKRH